MLSHLFQPLRRRLEGRHTVKAHLWQTAANYIQHGSALVLGVVLARLLDPVTFGQYAYTFATVVLCLLPASWSLTQALVTDGGKSDSLFQQVIGFAWVIIPLRVLIVLALAGWSAWRGSPGEVWLVLLIGLPEAIREITNVHRSSLEGAGLFRTNFWASILAVVCGAASIPAALWGMGVYALAVGPVLGFFGSLILYSRASGRPIFAAPSLAAVRAHLNTSFLLWLGGISDIAQVRVDKWFLGHFGTGAELGHYNRAFNYTALSHLALNSFLTNASVSALARAESVDKRRKLFLRTSAIVLTGGLLNFLAFHFYSHRLVPWIFGPKWIGSIPAFQALASLSLAYAVMYLPLTVLLSTRQFHTIAWVRIAGVLLLIFSLWLCRAGIVSTQAALFLQLSLVGQGAAMSFFAWQILRGKIERPAESV